MDELVGTENMDQAGTLYNRQSLYTFYYHSVPGQYKFNVRCSGDQGWCRMRVVEPYPNPLNRTLTLKVEKLAVFINTVLVHVLEKMKTIVTEIEDVEKSLEKYEQRLDVIERLQRLTKMTYEEEFELQKEQKLLEKKIIEGKEQLKSLRWENGKTMILSVMILGFVYLGITVYYGPLYT
ncbi:hypothetical protein Btru_003170 [Bulinus truncatus]|nr:hypothetical protein Btru_003170 [Bulinus truncatus]